MDEIKKGVFVSIRNGKLVSFVPFSNANYANRAEITERLQLELTDNVLEKMSISKIAAEKAIAKHPNASELQTEFNALGVKSRTIKPRIARPQSSLRRVLVDAAKSSLVPTSRWFTNNCLVSREKIHDWRSPEGDKNVALYLDMFSQLCHTSLSVPDCDFFLNLKDFPVVKKKHADAQRSHPYDELYEETNPLSVDHGDFAPVLSRASKQDFDDRLMPTEDEWRVVTHSSFVDYDKGKLSCTTPNTSRDDALHRARRVPLRKRKNVIVFRGTATGCGSSVETNIRFFADEFARSHANTLEKSDVKLDIGLTDANARLKRHAQTGLDVADTTHFTPATFMTKLKQHENKYILHLPGHVAAFRLAEELMSGSLVVATPLSKENPYKTSFWDDIRVDPQDGSGHVVQVKADLSDLDDTLSYYEQNPDIAQKVVDNAREFALRRFASKSAVLNRLHRIIVDVACARVPEKKTHDTVDHVHVIIIGERSPLAHKKQAKYNKHDTHVTHTFVSIIRSFGVKRVTATFFDPIDALDQATLIRVALRELNKDASISRFILATCDVIPTWECARVFTQKSACEHGPVGWSTIVNDGIVLAALDPKQVMMSFNKDGTIKLANKTFDASNTRIHGAPVVFKVSYDRCSSDSQILQRRKSDVLWMHKTRDTQNVLNVARLVFDELDFQIAKGDVDDISAEVITHNVLEANLNLQNHREAVQPIANLAVTHVFSKRKQITRHSVQYILGDSSFGHLIRNNLDETALQGRIATPADTSMKVWGSILHGKWKRGSFNRVKPITHALKNRRVLETCGGLGIDTFTMYTLGASVIVYENNAQRAENLNKNIKKLVNPNLKNKIYVTHTDWVEALHARDHYLIKVIRMADVFFLDPPWVVREGDVVKPGHEIIFGGRPFVTVVEELVDTIKSHTQQSSVHIVCKLPRTYPYIPLREAILRKYPRTTVSDPRTELVLGGILYLVFELDTQKIQSGGAMLAKQRRPPQPPLDPTKVHGFMNESSLLLGRVHRDSDTLAVVDVDSGHKYTFDEIHDVHPLHPSVVRCTHVFPASRKLVIDSVHARAQEPRNLVVCPQHSGLHHITKYVVATVDPYTQYAHLYPGPQPGSSDLGPQITRRFNHAIAVITIFRDSGDGSRTQQLRLFNKWVYQFTKRVEKEEIDVDTYVIEQTSHDGFNIGKLKNIGFCIAAKSRAYKHYIVCDVDATPDRALERYYIDGPRGDGIVMLANNGLVRYKHQVKFGFTTTAPFLGMAIMTTDTQFVTIGGFPNSFYSWGGEDVVFACRVAKAQLAVDYPKRGEIHDNEKDTGGRPIDTKQKQELLQKSDARGFYWEKTIRELKSLSKHGTADNGILQCVYKIDHEKQTHNRTRHIVVDIRESEDKSHHPNWFPQDQDTKDAESVKKTYNAMKHGFTWFLRSIP